MSDNLSETHAVLFSCTLSSTVIPLCLVALSLLYLQCCQTLQLFLFLFPCHPPPSLFLPLSLGLQGLHGKSTCCTEPLLPLLSVHVFRSYEAQKFSSYCVLAIRDPNNRALCNTRTDLLSILLPPYLTLNPSFPPSLSLVIFLEIKNTQFLNFKLISGMKYTQKVNIP